VGHRALARPHSPPAWEVRCIDASGKALGRGTTLSNIRTAADGLSFTALDSTPPDGERSLSVYKLKPGRYALKVDGAVVAVGARRGMGEGRADRQGPGSSSSSRSCAR
jgi:hypothetical protein